jgi:hypothetical protein
VCRAAHTQAPSTIAPSFSRRSQRDRGSDSARDALLPFAERDHPRALLPQAESRSRSYRRVWWSSPGRTLVLALCVLCLTDRVSPPAALVRRLRARVSAAAHPTLTATPWSEGRVRLRGSPPVRCRRSPQRKKAVRKVLCGSCQGVGLGGPRAIGVGLCAET